MNKLTRCALVLLLGLAACGDDDRTLTRPDGSVLSFDAAMLSRDASPRDVLTADSGEPDGGEPSCPGLPPVVDVGGLQTAFPSIDYSVSGADIRLISTNFVISQLDSPSGALVDFFAEVENLSARTECNLFADVTLDGADLIGLVQGPPHAPDILPNSVVTSCVPAFGRAVVTGLIRGVDLSSARNVRIVFDTFGETYSPASGEPRLVGEQREEEGGWVFSGTVTPTETIYNHSINVFTVDARGVISGRVRAFPGDLATLFSGTPVSFTTGAAPCAWDSQFALQRWLSGARPLVQAPTARQQAFMERQAQLDLRAEQHRGRRE